ncbi:S41 family peptidase [Aquimarina sp. 2304DJ70-9]|uniref:S41 family peptidase n=1 Tax=Aquimarina penaris TaxID=3231044 RepID=UPI00346264F9
MKYLKHFMLLLLLGSLFVGCFDDNDDVPQVTGTTEINDFIYKGMRTWYLYKSDVSDLQDNRFSSDQAYTDYLRSFPSPEAIFEALKANIDEFSFLVDDYVALEQAFDGISRNNGMEFGLVRYPDDPTNVFGYVRYVLPGTDAEAKGVQRGDIFNTVDGTQITDSNFRTLIDPDTYTIGLATFDGTNVTATGTSVTLNKVQYTENPIFINKTIDVGGNPVGYLMYNAFTADFDTQLNAAFAKLKSDNVTELILDLRYNGGGDVETAKDLSSMITGQFNESVFTTEEWNDEFQQEFIENDPGRLINLFDNQIRGGAAINSLNLTRLYILTTRGSASASELVINGLDPYINVIQVGDTTRGKFQASITVYDSDNFRRQGANTGHTYAMQPLVLKSINSAGFTDYFDGFAPEVALEEDLTNLGILGDENEPLLKAALDNIAGAVRGKQKSNVLHLEAVGNSNILNRDYEIMYHQQ